MTLFTTTWCGHCRRLKRQLDEEGVSYTEIDLDQQPEYADRIEEATGGYRTVPTVQVGDELLVNPTMDQLRAALA